MPLPAILNPPPAAAPLPDPAPLNRRQKRLYNDLCDLYRVHHGAGAGGPKTKDGAVYTLAYVGAACMYIQTPNISDETPAGRFKRMTELTTDKIRFPAGQEVAEGWYAVCRSLNRDGTRSPLYGAVHHFEGAPRVIPARGRRHANFAEVECMVEERPPEPMNSDRLQ